MPSASSLAGYSTIRNVPQTPQTLQTFKTPKRRRDGGEGAADLITLAHNRRLIQHQIRDLKTWELACDLRKASIAQGDEFEFAEVKEVAMAWVELSKPFLKDPDVASHAQDIWRKYKLAKSGGGNLVLALASKWTPPTHVHESLASYDQRLTHLLDFLTFIAASTKSDELFASQRDLAHAISLCGAESNDKEREKASKKFYRWLTATIAHRGQTQGSTMPLHIARHA